MARPYECRLMKVNLHIEKLVLDGITLSAHERTLLHKSVEQHLTRKLTSQGINKNLSAGGAYSRVQAPDIQTHSHGTRGLGRQIASAVHGGLSK